VSEDLKALIRTVPDFPRPGIQFRDITTLLKRPDGLRSVTDRLAAHCRGRPIDKVAAIESRGFMIGAPLALQLHAGFVPLRKKGKLPADNFGQDYTLEYGTDRLEMHRDGIERGERVAARRRPARDRRHGGGGARADRSRGRIRCRLRVRDRAARARRPRAARATRRRGLRLVRLLERS
jgi:hypothetical protein